MAFLLIWWNYFFLYIDNPHHSKKMEGKYILPIVLGKPLNQFRSAKLLTTLLIWCERVVLNAISTGSAPTCSENWITFLYFLNTLLTELYCI